MILWILSVLFPLLLGGWCLRHEMPAAAACALLWGVVSGFLLRRGRPQHAGRADGAPLLATVAAGVTGAFVLVALQRTPAPSPFLPLVTGPAQAASFSPSLLLLPSALLLVALLALWWSRSRRSG